MWELLVVLVVICIVVGLVWIQGGRSYPDKVRWAKKKKVRCYGKQTGKVIGEDTMVSV